MSDEIDRTVTVADLASLEARLEKRLRRVESRVQTRLTEEAKTTRRHFDVVAERMNDGVKLVAELVSHHSTVLAITKPASRRSNARPADRNAWPQGRPTAANPSA